MRGKISGRHIARKIAISSIRRLQKSPVSLIRYFSIQGGNKPTCIRKTKKKSGSLYSPRLTLV